VHVEVRPLRGPAGDVAGHGTAADGTSDAGDRRSPADRLREPGVRDAVVARAEDWVRCAWPGARARVVVHD
jgi:hypothetical protein